MNDLYIKFMNNPFNCKKPIHLLTGDVYMMLFPLGELTDKRAEELRLSLRKAGAHVLRDNNNYDKADSVIRSGRKYTLCIQIDTLSNKEKIVRKTCQIIKEDV